jgi:hypothetical protein
MNLLGAAAALFEKPHHLQPTYVSRVDREGWMPQKAKAAVSVMFSKERVRPHQPG